MLGFRKQSVLGVDFGTSHIKAVELTVGGNGVPRLVNYGHIEMLSPEEKNASFFSVEKSLDKEVARRFDLLLQRLDVKSKSINVALPGSSGLVSLVELPQMTEHEIERAIQFEATKHIPLPLDEVAFSWEIVSQKENNTSNESQKKKMIDVLLVAALRKEVERFEQYVKNSKLAMNLLELEIFSIARSVTWGNKLSGFSLIVDIGSRATNLILVREGAVYLNRSFSTGSGEITATLVKSFGVSTDRAEEIKQGDRDFFNNRESALAFSAIDLVTSEISRIFDMNAKKYPSHAIERIVLSGGVANMHGFQKYIANLYHVPVSIIDPWKNIVCDEILQSALVQIGSSFSVAVGLALGGIESRKK